MLVRKQWLCAGVLFSTMAVLPTTKVTCWAPSCSIIMQTIVLMYCCTPLYCLTDLPVCRLLPLLYCRPQGDVLGIIMRRHDALCGLLVSELSKIRSHATAADAQLTVLANWVEEQVGLGVRVLVCGQCSCPAACLADALSE
jgi:hypothetical protein